MKKHISICKYCGSPEYWGEMRWLNGKEMCRDCYRYEYEETYHKPYMWGDLDEGDRPTWEEYEAQNGT